MKFQGILLLLLAFQAVYSNVCDPAINLNLEVYSCENKLKDNKCAVTETIDSKNLVHVIDICGKDEHCMEPICRKREFKKLHGEKCYVNPECYSNICTDGKCVGLDEGKTCSRFQCKPNLSCQGPSPLTCKKLVAADGACTADSDCVFNHVCGTKTKNGDETCIKMFSLDNGSYSSNGLLCKSGYIYDKGAQQEGMLTKRSTGNDWLCSESTSEKETCTIGTDCTYKVDGDTKLGVNGDCKCDGKGLKGYCMLGTKDPVFQELLTIYADKVEGMELAEEDHVEYLRANWWGIPKLIQAKKNIENYQVLKTIDECAIRLVTGSNWIKVSGLFTILVITLF